MPSEPRNHRSCRCAPLLLLAVLPGCLTQMLWEDELVYPGVPQWDFELLGHRDEVRAAHLELVDAGVGDAAELVVVDGPGAELVGTADDAARTQVLAPDREASAEQVIVRTLLAADGPWQVVDATLCVERDVYLGDENAVAQMAALELTVSPQLDGIGQCVAAPQLPAAVRERLCREREARFAFPAVVFDAARIDDECRLRLAALDLAALAGQAGPATLRDVMFTDEHGRPVLPRRTSDTQAVELFGIACEVLLPGAEQVRRDLATLRGCTMWVAFHVGGQEHYARLAAHHVWLLGGGIRGDSGGDGTFVHRTPWLVRSKAAPTGPVLASLPCAVRLQERRLVALYDPNEGLGVIEKILLTPITLAVDIVAQGFYQVFLRNLDPDLETSRRGR